VQTGGVEALEAEQRELGAAEDDAVGAAAQPGDLLARGGLDAALRELGIDDPVDLGAVLGAGHDRVADGIDPGEGREQVPSIDH